MTPQLSFAASGLQRFQQRRVAIVLFDDVEVLDFAGPFEVFGVATTADGEAPFDVVTVALHPGPVTARNGLHIIPTYTARSLGDLDILIVPGGFGTRRELQNPAMLDFLRATSGRAELTMSVCTGSLLLGGAGLLIGLAATTHWAAMDELRALNSDAEILPDARIVDNGAVITAAGISAGIDAALYVVSRLLGEDRAQSTARYMQYDWRCGVDGETVVRGSA